MCLPCQSAIDYSWHERNACVVDFGFVFMWEANAWRGEMVISFLKLLQKLRFLELHEILRCSIFPMAQNKKIAKIRQN